MKRIIKLFLMKFSDRIRQKSLLALALSVILIGIIVAEPGGGSRIATAQTPTPTPTPPNDFLGGETHLLRNDDLPMSFAYVGNGGEGRQVLFTASTSNSNAAIRSFGDYQVIPPANSSGNLCTNPNGCYLDFHYYSQNRFYTGRFFNSDRDTTVIYPYQTNINNNPVLLSLAGTTVNSGPGLTLQSSQDVSFVTGGDQFNAAVADFNGDGYDDLLMAWSNQTSGNPQMVIATAVNVNDPTQGFKFGPMFTPASGSYIRKITVGDFNGDGQPEIVQGYIDSSNTVYIATYSVDKNSLTISEGGQFAYLTAEKPSSSQIEIATGRFTEYDHDQIVAGVILIEGAPVHLGLFDFAQSSIVPTKVFSQIPGDSCDRLRLRAGRFDWGNSLSQIAWMSSSYNRTYGQGTRLSIFQVDPTNPQFNRVGDIGIPDPAGQANAVFYGTDIAIGNFDNQTTDNPPQRDPDLQIAVVGPRYNTDDNSAGTSGVFIYSPVFNQDGSVSLNQNFKAAPGPNFFGGNNIADMFVARGDMQGRSYRLGRGDQLTTTTGQPAVVLATPPGHIDFINPDVANPTAPPVLLDFTYIPTGYKSQYSLNSTSSADTSQEDTTSWSFGTKISVGAKWQIGNPDEGANATIKETFKASTKLKGSNTTVKGNLVGNDYSITTSVGQNDEVWFRDNTFTIWTYEVIGRTSCPNNMTSCDPSQRVPLTIQFSGPSSSTDNFGGGNNLEWYQPVWEPGNIFSYPSDASLLTTAKPFLQLLSSQQSFQLDNSNTTISATWSSSANASKSTSFAQNYSLENDFSASGGFTDKKIGGFTASGSFDISGSAGLSHLVKSTATTSQSTGITVFKPGNGAFANPGRYFYSITPLIFGQLADPQQADTTFVPASGAIGTAGSLRTAFSVDTSVNKAFWTQAYNVPDVAVNHPNRWLLTPTTLGTPTNNCRYNGNGSSAQDCLTPQQSQPADPAVDLFHQMRGFFISSAAQPGQGPNLQTAVAGDQLTLQTRVYNYSMACMTPGTQVHARFYAQPMDPNTTKPLVSTSTGKVVPAFQVGSDWTGAPIPAFGKQIGANCTPSSISLQNWVMASTTFDTTNQGDQYLSFFVIVWMDDGTNLLPEMPGHGLTAKPTTISSLADAASLEQISEWTPDTTSTPVQSSFSNNVGFYNFLFYVSNPVPGKTLGAPAGPELKLGEVSVSKPSVKRGSSVQASVLLQAGSAAIPNLIVKFYDGDPAKGGTLFEVENVSHIRPGGNYRVRVNFSSQDCGTHHIFVKAGGSTVPIVSGQTDVQVDCPVPVCVSAACMRSAQYYALHTDHLPNGVVSVAGNGLNTKVSTSDATQMGLLLSGGASRQDQLNRQYVAIQLNLLAHSSLGQSSLQSNLACYKQEFDSTALSSGVVLSPSMTLGELFAQVELAARSGTQADQRMLANLLELINGDDPTGRCK